MTIEVKRVGNDAPFIKVEFSEIDGVDRLETYDAVLRAFRNDALFGNSAFFTIVDHKYRVFVTIDHSTVYESPYDLPLGRALEDYTTISLGLKAGNSYVMDMTNGEMY